MIISSTSDVTILVKAAPMMMPTARSITFPRETNSRNSLNMVLLLTVRGGTRGTGWNPRHGVEPAARGGTRGTGWNTRHGVEPVPYDDHTCWPLSASHLWVSSNACAR